MATSKSWVEKLNDSKDLPRVVRLKGKMADRYGPGTMVIPAPLDVDKRMRRVGKGKLTTIDQIRISIAAEHKATAT